MIPMFTDGGSVILQIFEVIVYGLIACVAILALFTDFFDRD